MDELMTPSQMLDGRLRLLKSMPPADRATSGRAPGGEGLRRLQRGLTGERRLAGSDYMDDPEALSVYLSYYWPVSYLQAALAMEEIDLRRRAASRPGFRPQRVLDLGAGPGPVSAALLDLGATEIVAADWSAAALGYARRLRAAGPDTAGGPVAGKPGSSSPSEPSISTLQIDLQEADALPEGPFDLVVASHALNELWKDQADAVAMRRDLAAKAWAALEPGGILLVIEPSALVTARPALELRDTLLASLHGAVMAAPCPTGRPCPALAAGPDRSCHSTWAWRPPAGVAALAAAAGLDRDSVKATWFALEKRLDGDAAPAGRATGSGGTVPSGRAAQPADAAPAGVAARPTEPAQAANVALAGSPGAAGFSRVVSEPMLNKAGRVRYLLCSPNGLTTVSAHRDDPAAAEAGFFTLGRGDLTAPVGLVPREGRSNFGFGPGSSLGPVLRAPLPDGSSR